MKRFLTWTFWIVSVLLLLFFGTIVVGTNYAKRVAPWPDPVPGISLTPSRPFLAASNIGPDNANFYFLQTVKFAEVLKWDSEDTHSVELQHCRTNRWRWSAVAYTNLDAWISTNREALNLLVLAAQLTNSQAPTVDRVESLMDELSPVMTLQRVHAYETARAFVEGRLDAAVSNIEVALRSAANFEPGQPMIGRLVAKAFDQLTVAQIVLAAQNGRLDRESNVKIAAHVEWRLAHREPLPEAMKYEAIMAMNLGGMVYEHGFQASLGLPDLAAPIDILLPMVGSTPDRTKEHVSAFYSHLIYACGNRAANRKVDALLDALCAPRS